MKRLTTNCPDNNLDAALNLFYIKDFETWVRGGGDGPDYPDIRLYDFIRKAAKILLPDLDFPMDDDGVDYAMGELLLDGPDEPTGLLALLYTAAWSYAELRGRLMQYEDTEMTPGEVKSMQEEHFSGLEMAKLHSALMELKKYQEADKDGRLVVLPFTSGRTLLCKENIDSPRLMKDVELAIRYCSSCGIVFHMDYNVFCDLVKQGRITAVSEEAEKVLGAKKDE
jgi:hypothetical protein|nr:MAG TPA: hypothetical protein [Caudoviricetes sp.]